MTVLRMHCALAILLLQMLSVLSLFFESTLSSATQGNGILGVHIAKTIQFRDYLQKVKLTLEQLEMLDKARQYFKPFCQCLLRYKALARSHLDYCCYLWADGFQYQLCL
ncbi:hypothetical protein EVAR_53956_1 [Eumeta japonica]|uniref:Uncharacterized protein n=1 Tax=Eumeta variegata TaxID=151549 RepID=A0A4C1Y1X2_EUMVA|nr:hypothetical protein EVAR_53956_1 [Eumeta japonica]